MSQSGGKTLIKGYVNNLLDYLKEAANLNDRLLALVQESEQEGVLNWYKEQLERVEDAKLRAESHLEQRLHEEASVVGSHHSKITSSLQITSSSMLSSSAKSSSKVVETRAKAAPAEIKARQLAEEERRRKEDLEKQLELDENVAKAREIAERARLEAEERRKIQEAKNEAIRLKAEAEMLENAENDPESLPNRLLDFEGELPTIATLGKEAYKRPVKQTVNPKTLSHVSESWIAQMCERPEKNGGDLTVCIKPSRDNLPKLKLTNFDGDPLRWPDCSSMFKSIVHDLNISRNAKMQHLQNSVAGKAKTAVEGYGYGGESYSKALEELESRFGKPSVVIKATLGKLRSCS